MDPDAIAALDAGARQAFGQSGGAPGHLRVGQALVAVDQGFPVGRASRAPLQHMMNEKVHSSP